MQAYDHIKEVKLTVKDRQQSKLTLVGIVDRIG